MDEIRREQVALFVEKFRDTAYTQEAIDEYAKLNGMDTIVASELSDFIYQVKHDEIMVKLYPVLLNALVNTQYMPEFAPKKYRDNVKSVNSAINKELCVLIEEHAVDYRMVDIVCRELGATLNGLITTAGSTLTNRAVNVLMNLAHKHFGGTFNMKNVKQYLDENGKSE